MVEKPEDPKNRHYFSYAVGGSGFVYYVPGGEFSGPYSFSELGKAIKEKWTAFRNKKKGYILTKTTED